jgi:glycosyltransferase involved in cell wall biosynthesis
MRIGIDAKWYFEGPPSGRRVVRSLVDTFLQSPGDDEWVIILNEKHRERPFAISSPRVSVCYVWAGNNMLSNLFVLPVVANRLKLDVILYQNFISPFGRGKKIAYIHDVLFLSHPHFYTRMERLYFSPLKFLTSFAHRIITVSEEEKNRLLAFHFGTADAIVVAHHGIDKDFRPLDSFTKEYVAEVKKQYHLPDRFILYVGRLNLRKNVDHLLKAIPLLEDKEIPLVLVGGEDWKKSNHAPIVEQLNLGKRIVFTGAIYTGLSVVYGLSRVFCFPSYAESFGLPPLEAMASGVPVVVSNTTSLPEVCGSAASYVNPDSPEQIAAAIDELLKDEALHSRRIREGIDRAGEFTWERACAIILRTIKTS